MKKHLLLIIFSILFINSNSTANDYSKGLSIWFDKPNDLNNCAIWLRASGNGANPDKAWETSSLPLGNGSIGANIMGSIAAERITLNEKTLWRGGPNTANGADYYWNVNKNSAHLLKDIRKAFKEGKDDLAAKLTRDNFNGLAEYEENAENPFRFGSFTTMGEIYIETGLSEVGLNNYKRILSLDSAMAIVSFDKDDINYERKYFISYPDSIMVIKYRADKPGMQNLKFSYAPNPESTGYMKVVGKDELLYSAKLNNNSMEYAIRIKAIVNGGELKVTNSNIIVKGSDEVIFIIAADTDYKMNFNPDFKDCKTYVGVDPKASTKAIISMASKKSYNKLEQRHKADYSSLFSRVKLSLNPNAPMTLQLPAIDDLPTYKRLERYRKGYSDNRLEETYFQFGRYLLIASSRKGNMPANLQGIWHNNIDGPWRVDYHNNINVQMNYWPAMSTNLFECKWPMIDFIRTLIKPGEKTAKSYFGTRGWTASISANIFGFTAPLTSKDMSWNFNPIAGPWLATHVWEYYDYTRDKKFLNEIGYDIIKSSAQFAVDYLWKKDDGTYTAAPSTSPEHGPIDQGATFVHAVIREILSDAIEASIVVGKDSKERKQWQNVIDKLAPYKIGRYGQLLEWSKDIDNPEDEHRHVNHLFGLHPGHSLSPITTPELAKAARVVLEHRGDGATGWSMGWKLNQWARLHDGNHAYKLFGNLLKNGTLDNLWDTHAPFQIDGNFGGTAGVAELLLQSHIGCIDILPALPDAWKDGEIKGLMARGNFMVDIAWKDNKLTSATIKSNKGGSCNIRYKEKTLSFNTQKNTSYKLTITNGKLNYRKL